MVFSVFFIVFTVAFARCLHDKGWLLKPCSCSANQIFSRDPAEKLAGFSTWDLLETEIKLRVLLEQHNYIFFGAMLSFDELFECLVLLIACRMSGNFSWQSAVLHWPFLRPMIAWLELTIADVHEYAEMMNRSISDDQERQVALSMEHHGCSFRASFFCHFDFSASLVSKNVATCLAWLYVLFSFCGDRCEFFRGWVWSVEAPWMRT